LQKNGDSIVMFGPFPQLVLVNQPKLGFWFAFAATPGEEPGPVKALVLLIVCTPLSRKLNSYSVSDASMEQEKKPPAEKTFDSSTQLSAKLKVMTRQEFATAVVK
jgi:hypothetical protein